MSPRAGNREKKTCVKGLSQNRGAPLPLPTAPLSSLEWTPQLSSGAWPVRRKTEQPLPFLRSLSAQLLPVDLRREAQGSDLPTVAPAPGLWRPPASILEGPRKGGRESLPSLGATVSRVPWGRILEGSSSPEHILFPARHQRSGCASFHRAVSC